MNAVQMKELVSSGQTELLESAWLEAIEQGLSAQEMAEVLESLVASGKADLAETLALTMLEERKAAMPPEEFKPLAVAAVAALPESSALREITADAYRRLHGDSSAFKEVLRASGLSGEQSVKRALRTLDVCLGIKPGSFLCNRFDHQVLCAVGVNPLGEIELKEPSGRTVGLAPRSLADEYEIVPESDFRVLHQHRPQELSRLLEDDPGALLVGLCISHRGKIDSNELKDELVPKFLPADKWSGWWSRARTAAKRCSQLSLEGRSPIIVGYYAQGRSLEDEMLPTLAAAKMPLEKLDIIESYVRQAKQRKVPVIADFVAPILAALAQQATQYQKDRTGDALAAALALEVAQELGLAAPAEPHPNVTDILAGTNRPEQLVCELDDYSLWPYCLAALAKRPDAAYQLTLLMHAAPTNQLDAIAALLEQSGAAPAIDEAIGKALSRPRENLDIFLWLWIGPKKPVSGVPGKVEMLSKILSAVVELDHDFQIGNVERKASRQKIRAAMSASDYASYRQALSEMSEAVAGTFKDRINRAIGLAETVRDDMMAMLRENFYSLFVRAKVEPWLDQTTIWTTQVALDKRQAALKHIIEVKMLENARAIGEAAAHGDLSENSEWKFAIEERDLLAARAAKLQEEIAMSRVIQPEDVPTDYVGVGSKVILERIGDGKRLELTFLGPWDSDLEKGFYSYQTGLGQDLMGKTIDDTVNVKFEGMEGEYRITALESGIAARKEGH